MNQRLMKYPVYSLMVVAMVFIMACNPVVQVFGSTWGWSSSEQGHKYVWFDVVQLETHNNVMKFTTDLMGRSSTDYASRGMPEAYWHSELRFYVTHGNTARGINGHDALQLAGRSVHFRVWIPAEMAQKGSDFVVQGMVKDTQFRNLLTEYTPLTVSPNGYWKDFTIVLPTGASADFDPNLVEAFVLRIETPLNSTLPLTRVPIYLHHITVS